MLATLQAIGFLSAASAELRGRRDPRASWFWVWALCGWARPGRRGLAAATGYLAGPGAEASSLLPETDSPALCRGDGARAARGDPNERRWKRWTRRRGGESRKADYLSEDAEPRRRLQPFPEKRKRRRRGERGGRECQRLEVVALGPGAILLWRAQLEGERPGKLRRSPQRRREGARPLLAPVVQPSFCQVPAPPLSPGGWPPASGAGEGIPCQPARVWRPRRHK